MFLGLLGAVISSMAQNNNLEMGVANGVGRRLSPAKSATELARVGGYRGQNQRPTQAYVGDNEVGKDASDLLEDTIIYIIGRNDKDEKKISFLNRFLELVNTDFKEEIFRINDASQMMGVNVETLRRKIRDGKIKPVEDEAANRIIYKLTGQSIIESCENLSQKNSIAKLYARKYPKDALLALMNMVIEDTIDLNNDQYRFVKNLVVASMSLSLRKEDLPQGEIKFSINDGVNEEKDGSVKKTTFAEIYDEVDDELRENIKDIQEDASNVTAGNDEELKETTLSPFVPEIVDVVQPETKIGLDENLKKIKMDQYRYDVEATDLSIEIVDLKLSSATDAQEKLALIEEKLKLVNKKQELAKKMEEFLLQQA